MSRQGSSDGGGTTARTAHLQAIGLVCLAGLLFVGMNSVVKALTGRFDPIMLIWARYFFHVLLILALFPRRFLTLLRTTQLGAQLGRSVLLLLSTAFNFLALALLPLGEVAAITFTSPIIVAALAALVLRERVSWARWLAILAGFGGMLLIIRPGAAALNAGSLLAAACALTYAMYQVSTRIVRESEPMTSLLYGGLVGVVALTVLVPFVWAWPSAGEWALLAVIGAMGAIGHLLIIMALRRAEASKVSPFIYLQLVWATLSSLVVFGDVPRPLTLLGALVIVGSGLFVYRLDMRARRGSVPAVAGR